MQSISPLFLARRMALYLEETGIVPLFGQTPSFDWKQYATDLEKYFPHFSMDLREQRMLDSDQILEGLGSDPEITPVLLSPLTVPFFWVMSKEDVATCTSLLLTGETATPFSSQILQEGYYRYLLLEALHEAKKREPLSHLTAQLCEKGEILAESAFCIDVQISLSQQTCAGRLVIPLSLKNELIRHFAELPDVPVSVERTRELELLTGLQVGLFHMDLKDWKTLQVGDAVWLDRGSYDPKKEQGVATLMLGSIPIFQTRVEKNRLTILEYAFYYEESMEGEKNPEEIESASSDTNEEVVAIQNYPVTVAVELGRLKITLEQLMRLSAGNTLELPIHPNQGVSLTVNGRLVGRGELISFNDALAVRILEIAN